MTVHEYGAKNFFYYHVVIALAFYSINIFITVPLCMQSDGPFVKYNIERAWVIGLSIFLWTAIWRWFFYVSAMGTLTMFFCWDSMEAIYLLGAYCRKVIWSTDTSSNTLPSLWWMTFICTTSLLTISSKRLGISQQIKKVNLGGLIVAILAGLFFPANYILMDCLNDGITDESIDFLIWSVVTYSFVLGEKGIKMLVIKYKKI
jgi:hypothetical protein